MCRNIKRLRRTAGFAASQELPIVASTSEFREAALNLVRKLSGYPKPSSINKDVFDKAVSEIASLSEHLVDKLGRKD